MNWRRSAGCKPRPPRHAVAVTSENVRPAAKPRAVESGWARSVFTTRERLRAERECGHRGYNTQCKKNGSKKSVGGVAYTLGRAKDTWRIVSYRGHPKGTVVPGD